MGYDDAITEGLGIQGAVILNSDFDRENLRVTLKCLWPWHLSRCGKCGDFLLELHSWEERKIRAPGFGLFRTTWIKLRYARGRCRTCPSHIVRTTGVPFIHSQFRSMTWGLFEQAGRMMEEMTCAATARLLDLDEKTLWRLDQWRMKVMERQLKLPGDLDCSKLSADEVHWRTLPELDRKSPFDPKHDIRFVTNLVCTREAKVIANASGRDARALATCLKELTKPQRLSCLFFAIDMNPGYFHAVSKLCPNAEIAIDRFHLVLRINEAFDKVRREEFAKAKKNKDEFQETLLGPNSRSILVERNPNLSGEERNMLGKLKMLNDNIHNAMIIVDWFHRTLDEKSVKRFRKLLAQWYGLVRQSKLKPMLGFAKLVMRYRKNIEAYIRSCLTTAISEGINNKIRVLKAMAYGYPSEKSYKLKILQRCGFLNSRYMKTNAWFWGPSDDIGMKPTHVV